ncbi:MAG: 16S rRNA (uracil(1498)-N(3))-methyltransferase [Candidatus Nitrohelix vancouverensis]|uniref:Ribosomal RNA small subunit methyltransferase E n=1 Tax=Candidatus Nitrohelix vancouverensis TaxID=2705534 RepID=A0A7T0C3V4_9BACT|nr:MAG: 16S rRNA (uracil(1498)-N(3))-methyltransferase [Candidatus Nitrohelix vancouverensis]
MTRRRFFVPPENIRGAQIIFREEDWRHIKNSLRLGEGDIIYAFDGQGAEYQVRLNSPEAGELSGKILERLPAGNESPASIILGLGMLKGKKFDDIIRPLVELGLSGLYPITMKRSIPQKDIREAKLKRWREIIHQAVRQSERSVTPDLPDSSIDLETFCQRFEGVSLKLILWEEENARRLTDLPNVSAAPSIACICGPEGGITPEEVDLARRYGFQSIRLGPRILKAETAPIAILSILQYLYGDF